jgi:hypothetical protein
VVLEPETYFYMQIDIQFLHSGQVITYVGHTTPTFGIINKNLTVLKYINFKISINFIISKFYIFANYEQYNRFNSRKQFCAHCPSALYQYSDKIKM